MRWDFWNTTKKDKGVKLPKPKDLPEHVGRKMVVDMKHDPDWVWALKMVSIAKKDDAVVFDFRIFDPVQVKEKGILVLNYTSLDGKPDMILFDGWYKKDSREMEINDRYSALKTGNAA